MFADEDPAVFNARIEALTRALDASPDVEARASAGELVRRILEFHGAGLHRLMRIVTDGPRDLREKLIADPVVAGLLALHELEPLEGTTDQAGRQQDAGTTLIQITRGTEAPAAPSIMPHRIERSRCERCGAPIGASHYHHVDVASRRLSCSCRACWLTSGAHGRDGALRAVPNRYLAGPSLALTESQWSALEIPVATAFFMFNSAIGRTIAFYPSPAGATESALSLEAWRDVEHANPWVRTAAPDVEAVLVRKERSPASGYQAFIVPIDACYDLVGRIRLHWSGLDGGETVRAEIDRFFDDLAKRIAGAPESAVGS